MDEKKVLLSAKDVKVQFRVRGRILTAIRGISLDIYEGESLAIVGESGSGKSVFTKTFAGMLDSNGYVSEGSILFDDPELSKTDVVLSRSTRRLIAKGERKLNAYAKLALGASTYQEILKLESEKNLRSALDAQEQIALLEKREQIYRERTDAFNRKQTLDTRKERAKVKETSAKIKEYDRQLKQLEKDKKKRDRELAAAVKHDAAYMKSYNERHDALKSKYAKEIQGEISDDVRTLNTRIAKEICLSIGRYPKMKRSKISGKLFAALKKALKFGVDLADEDELNQVFNTVAFRVALVDETPEKLHGNALIDLAQIKYSSDWTQVRGKRIATVFQDPMTSLNPIITIGKQITSVIVKHQGCSEVEARARALEMLHKVGIPNAEKRLDDYPFQYSGGMRQRIVIAIALSCQPKILICDEPTTALDVTIQAQILTLLKNLQKELHFTIVFITHDLGVVANIADRVAVMYAGQIVEVGTVKEIFYDPRHPYTWSLLSSMPQLAERNTKLFSITGTPPSLYSDVVGDAFAPRNPYCLKIDTLAEPPMFRVSDTHYAKTWLLDPDAPDVKKPEAIQDIHSKLMRAFNI